VDIVSTDSKTWTWC